MEKLLSKLIKIIAGLLLIIVIPAAYILWGYGRIDGAFMGKEQYVVRPQVDAESLSEGGCVRESRTVTWIKNRNKRVYGWVKIPARNKSYLCEWQCGFSGFEQDDAVTLT